MTFNELMGKTLALVDVAVNGDHGLFMASDSSEARLVYDQQVGVPLLIASIEGDLDSLIGNQIAMVYEHFEPPHASGLALAEWQLGTSAGTVQILAVAKTS